MTHKLQDHRKKIDQLDARIIELLAKRQNEVKRIGRLKKGQALPVYDANRELDMSTRRKILTRKLALDPLRVEVIFDQIMQLSHDTQEKIRNEDLSSKKIIRVGVMGGVGSFSEEAALQYVQQHQILKHELHYPITAENVLKALEEGKIDLAIFPIENSIGGLVQESISAASQHNFEIQEIFGFDVIQCLHALPGVKKKNISKIMSHPQALTQCKSYLKKNFPGAELIEASDTAEGARILAQTPEEKNLAVIASHRAGEIYGLQLLEEGVQDQKINITRFIAAKKFISCS